jgi:hypothetical protein
MPAVRCRDDHRVDFAAVEHVGIATEAPGLWIGAAATGTLSHGGRHDGTLSADIEHVAHSSDRDIEVGLTEVDLEILVSRVRLVPLARILDPRRVREPGMPDQALALTTETDDAEAQPPRWRTRNGVTDDSRAAFRDAEPFHQRLALEVIGGLPVEVRGNEATEDRH